MGYVLTTRTYGAAMLKRDPEPRSLLAPLRSIVTTLLAKMLSRTVHATRAAAASTGKREFSALFTAVDEFPG